MLCEVYDEGNFFIVWMFLAVSGALFLLITSGVAFYNLYVSATYETWKNKLNPVYPPPSKVKQEIVMTLRGLIPGTLPPALSLYLSRRGMSKAYCGVEPYGWTYLLATAVLVVVASDFLEWGYHYIGHTVAASWAHHKSHHQLPNPTPFAVVADCAVDQFFRALPMAVFPLIIPVNVDMVFAVYAVLFYLYGIVLHSGHDHWPGAHHPIINAGYNHFLHHSVSTVRKPYYTGFMLKLWDNLAGSVYKGQCQCIRCQPDRSVEEYNEMLKTKPDYSVLLQPSFWLSTASPSKSSSKAL